MVRESLTEYINRLLRSGYDESTIRNTLINAGYSPADIDNAIRYATKTAPAQQRKIIALTGKTVVIVVSALILIVLIVIGGIKLMTPEPKLIEFEILPTKTELFAGEKISFLNEFTSEQDRKVPVLLNLEVADRKTNQIIASDQLKIEIGARKSTTTEITIPSETLPGGYSLKAKLSYEGKSLQETFNFVVLETPTVETGMPSEIALEEDMIGECPATCDDYNKCTNDFCEKGICRYRPIAPCCGNGVCEEGETLLNCIDDCRQREETPEETIDQARQAALSDPESAAVLCSTLVRRSELDDCFSQIAISAKRTQLCENVQDEENRDRCYMAFALEGDFTVCAMVKNSYLSKACYSLARTEQLKIQATQAAKEQGIDLSQVQ